MCTTLILQFLPQLFVLKMLRLFCFSPSFQRALLRTSVINEYLTKQTSTQLTYRVKFSKQTPYLVSVYARPTFTLNSGSKSSTKLIRPLSRFMYIRKESFTTSQRRDQRKQNWWWPMQFRPWILWPPDLLEMGPSLREPHRCFTTHSYYSLNSDALLKHLLTGLWVRDL